MRDRRTGGRPGDSVEVLRIRNSECHLPVVPAKAGTTWLRGNDSLDGNSYLTSQ